MKSSSALAITLALSGAVPGCGDGEPGMLSGGELRDAALVSFPTDDGVPPLGEVKAVLLPQGDTVVVVNASDPFLHFYSRDGSFLGAAGRRGSGPNEVERLLGATVVGDTLHILGGLKLVSWKLQPPREVARSGVRLGTIALFSGCRGRLTVVYMGTSPATGERKFGIRMRQDGGWEDISDLGPLDSPLVMHPADFRPMHWKGGVYVNNYVSDRLERHDCRTGEISVTRLPVPEQWPVQHNRGTAEAQGHILMLAAGTTISDTTRFMAVRGDSVTAVVDIQGDFRLHGGPDSLLALVDYTPIPVIRLYHRDTLLRVLAR